MSYLLEALGRGLLAELRPAFQNQLPALEEDDAEDLAARLTASPGSGDLALRLGLTHLRDGRLAEAQAALDRAHELDSSSVGPLLALACLNDELGQLDAALTHLREAATRDAGDPAIAFGIAFCLERLGETAEAGSAYRHAIRLCPQLRNAYERLAAIAIRESDWPMAIDLYQRLAEMEPGDLDVLLTLGNLCLQDGRAAEAIERYQEALLIEPDDGDSSLSQADELAEKGRLLDAIQTLEKLVHKYPGVAPFHVRLGDLYVKAGKDTAAVAQYRTALQTQPSFLEATVKLGTQHMRQGRLVDAALTFNRAVQLNDRLMTAFVGLGVAQHDCGRTQESLATFDLAASLEPSTTLLFSETARLHAQSELERGDDADGEDEPRTDATTGDELLTEAIRRHKEALTNSPNHADLHYRLGLLARQVGDYAGAIEAFRNAIRINPDYSKALVKLGVCLKECDQTDEAIEVFQRALRLGGRYVDVHYQLGLLFAQRNRFEQAVEQFEQAAAAGDCRDIAFRANLALALQDIGMIDQAAATWQSICELSPHTDDLLAAREHILRKAQDK